MPESPKLGRISAGLLMFRRTIDPPPDGFAVANIIDVLLVHPGGPFWKNKDEGGEKLTPRKFRFSIVCATR